MYTEAPHAGGWHDGYTNAALRMAEQLPNCRALVGPWSHNWPDTVTPGPNIAFMDECRHFWDQHLRGAAGEGAEQWAETPRVRWYQCRGELPPGPRVLRWPGSWQRGASARGDTSATFTLGSGGSLDNGAGAEQPRLSPPVTVDFSGTGDLVLQPEAQLMHGCCRHRGAVLRRVALLRRPRPGGGPAQRGAAPRLLALRPAAAAAARVRAARGGAQLQRRHGDRARVRGAVPRDERRGRGLQAGHLGRGQHER